jgi:hypothetical protein
MNWSGRPPKVTREQYAELRRWKAARDALPSLRALAKRLGVGYRAAELATRKGIKRYEATR